MRKFVFLLSCALWTIHLNANPIDTNYFDIYKNDIIIRLFTSSDAFQIKQFNDQANSLVLKPNQNQAFGLGFSYRWLVFSFRTTVLDLTENSIYGKSSESNLALACFLNKHNFRLNAQIYKGFYIDNFEELGLKKGSTGQYPNMPNLSHSSFLLNYTYLTNGNKFSMSPFIIGNRDMKKTVGSVIFDLTVSLYRFQNDSIIGNGTSSIKLDQRVRSLTALAPYISAGYGQNIRITKHLNAMGLLTLGLGYEKQVYEITSGNKIEHSHGTLKLDAMLALSYCQPRYFISAIIVYQGMNHRLEKSNIETSEGRLMLTFGYRFKLKNEIKWIGNKIGL
jgi:hypothetical protein